MNWVQLGGSLAAETWGDARGMAYQLSLLAAFTLIGALIVKPHLALLLPFWLAAGGRPRHLSGAVRLDERFGRQVDVGLRLAELGTGAELHEFLVDESAEVSGAERQVATEPDG